MNNVEKLGVAALLIGVIAVGYSWDSRRKITQMYDLIENSVDEISRTVHVEAPQSVVDIAIDRAVNREVSNVIRSLYRETESKIRLDLQKEVKDSITKSFPSIQNSVFQEIQKQVSLIDISDLKTEIKDEAKERVISKFDGDLDSLLDDFNQNLKNVSKIYNSIADSMTNKVPNSKITLPGPLVLGQ